MVGIVKPNGDEIADFADAWARYCPPILSEASQASHRRSAPGRIKSCDTSIRHTQPSVTDLTCDGTFLTDVTDTPRVTDGRRLFGIDGGVA